MILIGYSGHAYVVTGILHAAGKKVIGYCDVTKKTYNPFNLPYIGNESSAEAIDAFKKNSFFIAIGDNQVRKKVFEQLKKQNLFPANAIHPSAVMDVTATLAKHGIMVAANVTINPLVSVGICAICNTGAIIEHECIIGDFAHVGPGAVLCGNVKVGDGAFIGAHAVVRQGINIGKNAIIGAGAVVVKDVADDVTVMGVPAK
ncbi:MAG TPA: acetyltransferase [Ferruginibacter sp.]|nr:acetyltransferase [Ferruginibacter sp.]